MRSVVAFLSRPGVQASEFKVALALLAWLGVNADQHWVSAVHGLIIAAPGIAYIISRGFAKTEQRTTPTPPA